MAEVQIADYHLRIFEDGVPADWTGLRASAALFDEYDVQSREPGPVGVAVLSTPQGRELVVAQHQQPSGPGFPLGVLLVPETGLLLIGAGERLLAYDIRVPERLWEDRAEFGFWAFARHGDVILMLAELELAAWTMGGRKLWTMFVEPPWSYTVHEQTVTLDVMGLVRSLDLRTGTLVEGSL